MRKTLLMIMILACGLSGCGQTSSTAIDDYLNTGTRLDEHAKDMMPALDDLLEYEDVEYVYTHKRILLFQAHSVALIVQYDEETYEGAKEKLADHYTFLNHEISSDHSEETIIPDYEFAINSYTFKVAKGNEESHTHYPKSFGMIATSDEKQRIAYLYFYDFDLDYIGDEEGSNAMVDFVKDYFDYDFED
ncbi:hypothetical protein MUN88_07050 [Gracilibacillus caseinilyticus]|uniref:Lipoprotein n=1 Tax=Gracilibacillus caseinilyticus TaxID=2932256 RepID=A0ABY4EZJ8_9BACI|nr:hypothetical protein [Gracilibacillus caseinilyticus]UOQ49824.1 hypothetical protein MUN88_07050 [Gracilibacillus caseinilyticus]